MWPVNAGFEWAGGRGRDCIKRPGGNRTNTEIIKSLNNNIDQENFTPRPPASDGVISLDAVAALNGLSIINR